MSKLVDPLNPEGATLPDRPAQDPELAAEQTYVDGAYARLEAMRAAAERVRDQASFNPRSPVQALAFPLFTTIALVLKDFFS
jgi:hypothetical protein